MESKFFSYILGLQGSLIMESLAKTSEELAAYIPPRVIVGWLRQLDYGDVELPKESLLKTLSKNGYGFSGSYEIEGEIYSFNNTVEEHVAAIVAVASNSIVKSVDIKEIDLAKLAKTIDLLIGNELKKAAPKAPANQFEHQVNAQNLQPEGPVQPEKTQPAKQLKIPSIKKPKKEVQNPLTLTRSESKRICNACGQRMFDGNVFVGCICFKPLAKNAKTTFVDEKHLTITFDEEWDQDSVLSLIEVIKNGR